MFKSIKTKFGVFILSFIILMTAIVISTYWLTYTQKEYGLLINLSGRQRMLSQKIFKELHAYTHMRIKASKNQAAESSDLFDQTLKGFKYGGEVIDAKGSKVPITSLPHTKEISGALDASLRLWNIYKTKVNIILTEDIDSAKVKEAIDFIEKNNLKLLNQMNLLTAHLQEYHDQKVSQLSNFQILALFLTFILSSILYLRLNKIVGPILQLKKAAEAFQAGNGDYCKKYCHVKTGDEIEVLGNAICDMTQKISRDVEELKKVDSMKTEFMSMVSHELRTPLTPIKGYLSLFLSGNMGELTPKQKNSLLIIKKQSEHLLTLIDSILDVSRLETGQLLEVEKAPTFLDEVIKKVAAGSAAQIEQNEINLALDLAKDLPAVMADEAKLTRVITNLLGNAVKFTPKNGKVTIKAFPEDNNFQMQIIDNGIGLAPENLEKVFEKFYQVDSSYTRAVGGIGMGLTIAKEIVEAHGGKIWAESAGPGKGSRFIFTLPIS